jgi:3-deoxy-D-manno-octulosonic-acid transferase
MNNFHKIMADFLAAGAVVQLPLVSDSEMIEKFTERLIQLFQDKKLRTELGDRARQVIEANRGALRQQVAIIAEQIAAVAKSEPQG